MYITFINPFYLSDKTIWLILVSGLFLICMIYAASKLPHRNPVYTAVSNAAPIVFGLAVLVGSVICLGFMMQMIQREDDESPFRVHAFRVMEVASGYELRISDIGLTAAGKPSFDSVGETQIKLAGIISDPALEPASAYQQRIQFLRTLVGQNITARTFYQRTSMVSTVTQVEYPGEAVMQDGRSLNEVLLHDGYAIFNINDDLYPDERRRLDAAENDAISHKRGVWQEPGSKNMSNCGLKCDKQMMSRRSWKYSHGRILGRTCMSSLFSCVPSEYLLSVLGAIPRQTDSRRNICLCLACCYFRSWARSSGQQTLGALAEAISLRRLRFSNYSILFWCRSYSLSASLFL